MKRFLTAFWLLIASISFSSSDLLSSFNNSRANDDYIVLLVADVALLNQRLKSILDLAPSFNQTLSIKFTTQTVISESIDFGDLILPRNFSFKIVLRNFRGFVADSFQVWHLGESYFTKLILDSGQLNFYGKTGQLLDSDCGSYLKSYYGLSDEQYRRSNKSLLIQDYVGLFSLYIPYLYIFGDVAMNNAVCPLVFKNANLFNIDIFKLENSMIIKNVLRFVDMSEKFEEAFDLNCQVDSFQSSQLYRIDIDKSLLNKDILAFVTFVNLQGVIESIASDVFKSFSYLKYVLLTVYHLRKLFHSSNRIEWIKGINFEVDYDPEVWKSENERLKSEMIDQVAFLYLKESLPEYDYPEEDFCLFTAFPHRQLVLPLINLDFGQKKEGNAARIGNVSCAMLYLAQYSSFGKNKIRGDADSYLLIDQQDVEELSKHCDFKIRVEMCLNLSTCYDSYQARHQELNFYDALYILQWIELVGPIITFPIVCLLGFVFNLIIALVIQNKGNQAEHFKGDRMYQYMLMNSIFNMIECFISLFVLLSECLGPNSLFCSKFIYSQFGIYIKIYLVQYFGECMKTCSLLTLIAFSLERYIITSNCDRTHKILNRFTNMNLKHFVVVMTLFSFATCVCKIYEFNPLETNLENLEYPYLSILYFRDQPWFLFTYVVRYMLNDVVLLFANLVIDLKLFVILRRHLVTKRKVLMSFKPPAGVHLAPTSKKFDEIRKAESNTNKMVIYSFVVYSFCRLPEVVFYLHLLFIQDHSSQGFDYYTFCQSSVCYLFINSIQYLYMLSYLTNIFFYFELNKPFRQATKRFFCYSSCLQ